MQRVLILGSVFLAFGAMGVTRFRGLEERLEELDRLRREVPENARLVQSDLMRLETELEADAAAWRLPGELVARVRSRTAYLAHRIEQARTRAVPMPRGPALEQWVWPLDPAVVNSEFGWRDHPIDGHTDLPRPIRSPPRSAPTTGRPSGAAVHQSSSEPTAAGSPSEVASSLGASGRT